MIFHHISIDYILQKKNYISTEATELHAKKILHFFFSLGHALSPNCFIKSIVLFVNSRLFLHPVLCISFMYLTDGNSYLSMVTPISQLILLF